MQLFISTIHSPLVLAALSATVAVAAWTDWRSWRIPNALVAASMAAALMLALFAPGSVGIGPCLLGGLTGFALFMPLYLLKGMAAGDVKLMVAIGMYVGAAMVLDIAILSCLIGGAWALVLMDLRSGVGPASWLALQWKARQHAGNDATRESHSGMIPYGVVIAGGTMASIALTWR